MKFLLFVSAFLTISSSWGQTAFVEETVQCKNGTQIRRELSTTAGAQFLVTEDEGHLTLQRITNTSGQQTTYSLTYSGVDAETQQSSYIAFSPLGSYFIVVISQENQILFILENDRDFTKCNGGMVVVSLAPVYEEAS